MAPVATRDLTGPFTGLSRDTGLSRSGVSHCPVRSNRQYQTRSIQIAEPVPREGFTGHPSPLEGVSHCPVTFERTDPCLA
jgi:hypothetical protein